MPPKRQRVEEEPEHITLWKIEKVRTGNISEAQARAINWNIDVNSYNRRLNTYRTRQRQNRNVTPQEKEGLLKTYNKLMRTKKEIESLEESYIKGEPYNPNQGGGGGDAGGPGGGPPAPPIVIEP